MVAIKNILLFITAVTAATLGKRDTATILKDIKIIDSATNNLNAASNGYTGGLASAVPSTYQISFIISHLENFLNLRTYSAVGNAKEWLRFSIDHISAKKKKKKRRC